MIRVTLPLRGWRSIHRTPSEERPRAPRIQSDRSPTPNPNLADQLAGRFLRDGPCGCTLPARARARGGASPPPSRPTKPRAGLPGRSPVTNPGFQDLLPPFTSTMRARMARFARRDSATLPEWRTRAAIAGAETPDSGGLGLARRSRARRLLVLVLDRRELEVILTLDVDLDRVAAGDLPAKQVLGKVVFDPARDDAPQGAGAIDPVVTLFREQVLGSVGDLDRDLLLDQVLG